MRWVSRFVLNEIQWKVVFSHPQSPSLIDRTGRYCLATTDPTSRTVYLSSVLSGEKLITVFLHELGHCVIFSYNLMDEIHSAVYPDKWIEAEEWVCNFVADYGRAIFRRAYEVMGYDALDYVPYELNRLIA